MEVILTSIGKDPKHLKHLIIQPGLPRWCSDEESTCQCRGPGFNPWSGKIPTCRRATKPACHNYQAHVPQLLKSACLEPMLCNKRSHRNEKPAYHNEE